MIYLYFFLFFFFQAEDGIRDHCVTGVQTCALPICFGFIVLRGEDKRACEPGTLCASPIARRRMKWALWRSEEHTSELQSHSDLVCRLLLEKKKKKVTRMHSLPSLPPTFITHTHTVR